MSILITDTSPVISLAVCNSFYLPEKLYPNFYLPKSVLNELELHLPQFWLQANRAPLNAHTIADLPLLESFNFPDILGAGEIACINLCTKLNISYLFVDDKDARLFAESLGIKCIETLGLLIEGKGKKIIPELSPLFIKLINHKRHFSKALLNNLLKMFQEPEIQ